jgi:hypothetical protein
MDPHLRQLFNEAIALDDKAREDCAAWEAKRAERTAQARSHLVYKIYAPKVAAQQQRTTPMVDAVSAAWVQARLEQFAAIIGEETGKTDAKLLAKIETLQAEVEILRQQNKAKDLSGVVSLQRRAS